MLERITFYNEWHNGDIFSGKAYLNDIIRQLPEIEFAYAHSSHHKVMADLPARYLPNSVLNDFIRKNLHNRVYQEDKTLFLNTWVGAWHDYQLPTEPHGNWAFFHRMYSGMYSIINQVLSQPRLTIKDSDTDYYPETDFSYYQTAAADMFVSTQAGRRMHLFCNGHVRASQSYLGLMEPIIQNLSELFNNDVIICTAKFPTSRPNIFFTDDIFNLENDINEIAYLSTFCRTIIGKNSGPYMFCHLKPNFVNPNMCFVSLSNRVGDSYPAHTTGFKCHYLHHCSDDPNGARGAIYSGMNIDNLPAIKKLSLGRCMPV